METGAHSEIIAGTPQRCMDALLDFETYPAWQSAVHRVEVLERDAASGVTVVAFTVKVIVAVHYTLRYVVEAPDRLSWQSVAGDVKHIEGHYSLEDRGDGTTRATYHLGIDAGRKLPGPMGKLLARQAMRRSVVDLKHRVERA